MTARPPATRPTTTAPTVIIYFAAYLITSIDEEKRHTDLSELEEATTHELDLIREEFEEWKRVGEDEIGFSHVESGPLVRSSYHAKEQAWEVEAGGPGSIVEVMEKDIPAPAEVLPPLVQLQGSRPRGPSVV